MSENTNHARKLAVMGGAYGNLAALQSCLADASRIGAGCKAFIGDGIGCCGHSEEVVAMIRAGFDLFVAGNHEQQAVARSSSCGCGYSSHEDEKISCEAFELATAGLGDGSRDWLSPPSNCGCAGARSRRSSGNRSKRCLGRGANASRNSCSYPA